MERKEASERIQLVISFFALAVPVVAKDCKFTIRGYFYNGNTSFTRGGVKCQRWDEQTPHSHTRDWMLPGNVSDHHNYCRNPDEDPEGPWCYTVDPQKRWDLCNIPVCTLGEYRRECKETHHGVEYRGTLAVTKTGKICQRWNPSTPFVTAPDNVSSHENFCRNFDDDSRGPWCNTINNEREYCNVPTCDDVTDCIFTTRGSSYMGRVAITADGRRCKRWDVQSTDRMNYFQASDVSEQHNFCRNPSEYPAPWCFTADGGYGFCEIPTCPIKGCIQFHWMMHLTWVWNITMDKWVIWTLMTAKYDRRECRKMQTGVEYRGTMNVTALGFACQRWDTDPPSTPTMEYIQGLIRDNASLHENFCRNFNEDKNGPWCITQNPDDQMFDYCNVPLCNSVVGEIQTTSQDIKATTLDINNGVKELAAWNGSSNDPTNAMVIKNPSTIKPKTGEITTLTLDVLKGIKIIDPSQQLLVTPINVAHTSHAKFRAENTASVIGQLSFERLFLLHLSFGIVLMLM